MAELLILFWCGTQSFFVLTAYYRCSFCAKVTRENIKRVPRLEELSQQFLFSLMFFCFLFNQATEIQGHIFQFYLNFIKEPEVVQPILKCENGSSVSGQRSLRFQRFFRCLHSDHSAITTFSKPSSTFDCNCIATTSSQGSCREQQGLP